jgi:S-adenosylmethionine/arginine decarboxylase-like enzyme
MEVFRFSFTLKYPPLFYSKLNKTLLSRTALRIARGLRLTPCGSYIKKYGKNAYTLVQFLRESHIILTTYLEDEKVELDIQTCVYRSLDEVKSVLDHMADWPYAFGFWRYELA